VGDFRDRELRRVAPEAAERLDGIVEHDPESAITGIRLFHR
jgi:hypothetical protein